MTINFCPQPLNKVNVIKISFQTSLNHRLKELLLKAILSFNETNESYKIHNKTEKYKIKLSKKSGLPDLDLPCKYKIFKI